MKSIVKGLLMFTAAELGFYLWLKPHDREMFYLLWAVFACALLLYNTFNVSSNHLGYSGLDDERGSGIASDFASGEFDSSKKVTKFGKIINPHNITCLLMTLLNGFASLYLT